ncbi:MAG: peptide-methionine (S)-S-oxide reductase MsrA [Myxococcota bacterium]
MRALVLGVLTLSACTGSAYGGDATELAKPLEAGQAEAIFAGGCFWCIESDFEKLKGVIDAQSGYTGGEEKGSTYKQVGYGLTGHVEGIRVVYDPKLVSYPELVEYFFHHIDPTQTDGQFCDRGPQYTTAVFVHDEAERKVAVEAKRKAQADLAQPVVTPIRDVKDFWLAEEYHQDFYKKNPDHYKRYRTGCGRDARVHELWGEKAGAH